MIEVVKFTLSVDRWIRVGSRMWIREVHGCYVLQEQCVLGWSFSSISSLECCLGLSALTFVGERDDGLVVTFDDGRDNADGAVQLRV